MKTLSRSAVFALLAVAVCVSTADAQVAKCQRTIAKASSQFVQAKAKALQKCNAAVVKAGTGSCPDQKATDAIAKASGKLSASIGKSCGGADKLCGGDTTGEFTAVQLGWPDTCPNFERGTCNNAITSCGDIATCIECIDEAAVDQAMTLYYGDIALQTADSALNKCQGAIGKATTAFLNAKSKALQKCWDARLNGKHSNSCVPPAVGDGKYLAAIQKATDKKEATICKACGGADKVCGNGDDFTPAQIGFAANCPAVTVPGGSACGDAISTLQDIVDCVDCVTEFKADCADRNTVPQFASYPSECGVCVTPPLTGTCPTALTFTADGPKVDLDTGFTGLAHNAHVPTNGRLTLSVSGCANANHPCGVCNVSGPLPNTGGAEFNNHRCQDSPWVQCSVDQDCVDAGATGPCIFFFGSPLPLVAGGVPTCVVNEISGVVSGTADIEAGSSTTNVPLKSKVHPTGTEQHPCPACTTLCQGGTNDNTICTSNADCTGGGTCGSSLKCSDGPRTSQACTPQGTGLFGDVTLDCPPNPGSNAGTLTINLNISTGTQTRTLSTANPLCLTGPVGSRCFCDTCNNINQESCSTNADCPISGGNPGICGGKRCVGGTNAGAPCISSGASSECPGGGLCGRPGQPTRPNVCLDDTTTGPIEACIETDAVLNEGQCEVGPTDQVCSTSIFHACISDPDCTKAGGCPTCVAGETCINRFRPCFTDNGSTSGPGVKVVGSPDVPCGDTANPTVGTFFCVAPVGSTAVNAAGGLPALGRVRIPGTVSVQ